MVNEFVSLRSLLMADTTKMFIKSVNLYAHETWTMVEEDLQAILGFSNANCLERTAAACRSMAMVKLHDPEAEYAVQRML